MIKKILLIFCLWSLRVGAQPVNELIKLPKDSLINKAIRIFTNLNCQEKSQFDLSDFKQIEVWANDKEVTVLFNNKIKFVPFKLSHQYFVQVSLIQPGYHAFTSIAQHDKKKDRCDIIYNRNSDESEKIRFILNKLNRSNLADSIPYSGLVDKSVTIIEDKRFYMIIIHPTFYETDFPSEIFQLGKRNDIVNVYSGDLKKGQILVVENLGKKAY
jgi:hypothetical protein